MSISITGLGSGLDYDSWIEQLVAIKQAKIDEVSAKAATVKSQKSTLSTLQTKYTSLQTAAEAFTNTLSSNDVFNKKSVTSSSDAITATVTSGATAQSVKVSVSKLATATTAQSSSAVASYIDSDTLLSDIAKGSVKEGTFSVYVDGTKTSINIASGETVQNVLDDLNAVSGVSASLSEDGKLSIQASGASTVTVGSSSDTSNFGDVMSLVKVGGVYSSSKSIFDTNTGAILTSASFENGAVTTGKFTIGTAEFEVKATTTLDSLIKEINANEDAGVTAAWDSNSGKLLLTAKDEGAVNINVQSDVAGGGSNFTYIMGLTTADGQSLATDSQELGSNAILTINGTQITSSSNTVTSDISGITGLTLTLNEETAVTANVDIETDTDAITDAITAFVSAYNVAITSTDSETSSDGDLYGESVLTSIRNKIRSSVTAGTDSSGLYKTLASIGITTGKVSTDVSADTTKLTIDSEKLKAALEANPDAVKELLAGNSATGTVGVLDRVDSILDGALDLNNGYFATTDKSFDKEVSNYTKKVESMTADLKDYNTMLEAKFQAMDTLISNLKNQSAVFDSYFNKDKSSSSSSSN